MSVTPYNFQKPGPLGVALDHKFAGWLKTLCALLTRKWLKLMPTGVSIQFQMCDSYRAADLLADLSDSEVGYPLALQEKLITFMSWPRPLALALAGGIMCATETALPADRELTAVEEALFDYFLKDLLLPTFVETWPGSMVIKPELGPKEVNPRWSRIFPPDESVVCAVLLIKGPFGEQEFRWMLPKKGLMAGLGQGEEHDAAQEQAGASTRLKTLVHDLPVDVNVLLGTVELSLTQLAKLRPGDVIVLNQRINQPLVCEVAGEKKLRGWAGRLGGQQAFQIEAFAR